MNSLFYRDFCEFNIKIARTQTVVACCINFALPTYTRSTLANRYGSCAHTRTHAGLPACNNSEPQ